MATAKKRPATVVANLETSAVAPRILVVDDEPGVVEAFRDMLRGRLGCAVFSASTLREAKDIINCEGIELLVTDVKLPDGDGLSLLAELRDRQPGAVAVVMTGAATTDRAVAALRGGAIDFLAKPFSADQLADRVGKALLYQQLRARREIRMVKLKTAVKKLNAARKTVNKKVDLLCNDLISAYGELSRQIEQVRVQESYRNVIEQAGGLEQLLCHTMDWMLRQVGYCNIGVWLVGTDQDLQLGAFMKYTVAAEPDLCEALQKNLLRVTMRRGFVRLQTPEAAKGVLTPGELKYLANQDVVAINCTYLGETLAVLALFRDGKTPFSEDDINAIKVICPLFALSLAKAVKGLTGPEEGEDPTPEDGPIAEGPDPDQPKRKRKPSPKPKKDPADWWKTGEAPPF